MKVLTGNSRLQQQQAVKRRLGDTNTTAVHSVLKFTKIISVCVNVSGELMRPFLYFFSIIADTVVEYIVIPVATISWFQPPRQSLCVFAIIVTHNCWTRWQPKIKVLSFSTFIFLQHVVFLYINNNTIYIEHRKRTTEKIFFLLFVNSYVHALSRSETRVLFFSSEENSKRFSNNIINNLKVLTIYLHHQRIRIIFYLTFFFLKKEFICLHQFFARGH